MILSLFRAFHSPARSEPVFFDVAHLDKSYRVAVKRRPAARRFTLRVSNATGEVTLTLPERADIVAARRFAEAHGGWIATRMARRPVVTPFIHGTSIPLRGVPHRIVHWSSIRGVTQATTDKDGQPILAVCGQVSHVPRRVGDFLKREAMKDLEVAVLRHTKALGIPARKITVRDTISRWGSCTSRGHLNFSWRLIMAPPLVLDYLAAHEVAHLKEMNHSDRFWTLLKRLAPHTDEAESWLTKQGSSLHRYGKSPKAE
jgi:predicted metal-dependent hydrolase